MLEIIVVGFLAMVDASVYLVGEVDTNLSLVSELRSSVKADGELTSMYLSVIADAAGAASEFVLMPILNGPLYREFRVWNNAVSRNKIIWWARGRDAREQRYKDF